MSIRSIFWTIVRFYWPPITKKEPSMGKKGGKNRKFHILKPNMISKSPKSIVWQYKPFATRKSLSEVYFGP